MASEVVIANTALRRLGANTITSFMEGSKSANCVLDFFEETRDDLLRAHAWNFATKRAKLAQLANAPAFGFDHAYGLPAGWIRTISVHDNDGGFGTVEYKAENQDGQNVLLCSSEDVYLRYVARVTDPNRMPPDFRAALSRRLAAAMALDLTKSNTIKQQCDQEAEDMVRRAKSADAMGSTPERRPSGSWAMSRGGWRNR
jgi:hypothetical protein